MNKTRVLRAALWGLGGAAAAWLFVRFLLPLLLPFLLGLLVARLAQRPVRFLREKGRLPGWLASGAVVLGMYGLLGVGLWWLCRTACGELARFTGELPALLQSLAGPAERLRGKIDELTACAPTFLQKTIRESVDSFFSSGRVVAGKLYDRLFSLVSKAVAGVPNLALFLVTTVVSSVMLSSQYDTLAARARQSLPAAWREKLEAVSGGLRKTFSVWFKAECKLAGITFLLVTGGLMLLRAEFPLLFGALTALVDALPVFGAGTVLIPWSVLCFLRGERRLGFGLLALYAAAYLARAVLEPRLVGRQAGLNPLATLFALYAGFKLLGVPGMLLFPLGAVLLKQVLDHAAPTWKEKPQGGE